MRYHYTSNYLNSLNKQTPQGVKILLIVNIAIFLLLGNNEMIEYYFALVPSDIFGKGFLWQCITYSFLHGGLMHLLFNMLGLWFLGYELEHRWGTKKFLQYYFIVAGGSGIITAIYMILMHLLMTKNEILTL